MTSGYEEFLRLLREVGLIDERYPVRGCLVWRPYGYRLKERVHSYIEKVFRDLGYEPYQFPRLIRGEALRSLSDAVYDFTDGVYWLTDREGEEYDLYMTPTGETAFYTMFDRWISSEDDLPLRAYQRGSIFRPASNPNILLNGQDRMDVTEAHGAFASETALNAEYDALHRGLEGLHEDLAIPTLALLRPAEGNKPVYEEMVSYETYLPSKGRAAFAGMLYKQGQIYSRAMDVSFDASGGAARHPHQITFGFTDRIVTELLDLHRDDRGLRLLPKFAPVQTTVVPVYDGEHNERLREYARQVATVLDGYRTVAKTDDLTPGAMLARAEQRGIPLQIGVSIENCRNETVRAIPRTRIGDPDRGVPIESLPDRVDGYFDEVESTIREEATAKLHAALDPVSSLDAVEEVVDGDQIARLHWCGSPSCQRALEDEFRGELLGTAMAGPSDECLVCGAGSSSPSYFSKRVATS